MARKKFQVKRNKTKKQKMEKAALISETEIQNEINTGETVGMSGVKTRPSKWFYLAAIIFLVGLAIYFGAKKYGHLVVVANVNGQPITRLMLWQKLEKRFGQQMLDELVNESIIRGEMQKKHITITQKDVDKKIKELESRFKGAAGLDQMLAVQGMTRDDLRSQIELQLAIEKMVPAQKVTDEEIRTYFDNNQSTYGEELTETVKSEIKNLLLQQKTSKTFSEWFDKVKKQTKVYKYL